VVRKYPVICLCTYYILFIYLIDGQSYDRMQFVMCGVCSCSQVKVCVQYTGEAYCTLEDRYFIKHNGLQPLHCSNPCCLNLKAVFPYELFSHY